MDKDNPLRYHVVFILGSFFASFILLSILYPDLWFYHTRRVLAPNDISIPFESTFMLVSQFFHGGVQLWDRFDQVNNAYFVSTNGIYGVVNILTALIYCVLSPFFSHPGMALYHTHVFIFYSLTCLIRIIGGYLLLRKFISHQGVLFIALLYLNTILTSFMMTPGLSTQCIYSFLPLVLYFILCFFEDLRLRSFLGVVLSIVLCFINSPYNTLGYFYQVIHIFILCLVVGFVFQRDWRRLQGRPVLSRQELFKNMALAVVCILIILPYSFWAKALVNDFYVFGSGLNGTQGRFNHIFNLSGYFNIQDKSFANPLDFLGTSLDFYHNVWGSSWVFLGLSTLFFALMGIVLSKDKRKHLFWASILFIILINTACFSGNFFALGDFIKQAFQDPSTFWGRGLHLGEWILYIWLMVSSIAHGINALTNPFSFLVRSFQITTLFIPILLLPLLALGLESCFCLWQKKKEGIYFKRRWFLLVFFALVLYWDLSGGSQTLSVYSIGPLAAQSLKEYILCMGAAFFLFILCSEFLGQSLRWLGWVILGFVFLIDFMALMRYAQFDFKLQAAPCRVSPCYSRHALWPDFQNPRLLPVREFLNVDAAVVYPNITDAHSLYGAFYQYGPIGRFFHPWTIYEPRHIAYRDLYPDGEIQQYLRQNPRTLFFADVAFDSRYIRLAEIMKHHVANRVVAVEREEFNKSIIKTTDSVYIPPMDSKQRIYKTLFKGSDAGFVKRPFGWEYTVDLPKDFPSYLTTTVFTYDYTSWRLSVGERNLDPMQGELTAPGTFDVGNIHDKQLTFLLSSPISLQAEITLQVKLPERIVNVWKNTYDDLGLSYEAPKDGWLVFNYPYDKKWELNIDGLKTPLSRVNKYFIGAPISGGRHEILLRYWPQTTLRLWILISMILSVICFLGIVFYSIKQESIKRKQ